MYHSKLSKILEEMGIPEHLTCLLKTCVQVKKQQLELDMEQLTGSKPGQYAVLSNFGKALYCHPAYLYAENTMQNAGWDEA